MYGPGVRCATLCLGGLGFRGKTKLENGRGDRIRTCDPLLPKQMRYQTALLPDGPQLGEIVALANP